MNTAVTEPSNDNVCLLCSFLAILFELDEYHEDDIPTDAICQILRDEQKNF